MQFYDGSGNPMNAGGYISTEHTLYLNPDGTSKSDDFVGTSSSQQMNGEMTGRDCGMTETAGEGNQGQGRFFVIGSQLFMVESQSGAASVLDIIEGGGCLVQGNLRFVRQ